MTTKDNAAGPLLRLRGGFDLAPPSSALSSTQYILAISLHQVRRSTSTFSVDLDIRPRPRIVTRNLTKTGHIRGATLQTSVQGSPLSLRLETVAGRCPACGNSPVQFCHKAVALFDVGPQQTTTNLINLNQSSN